MEASTTRLPTTPSTWHQTCSPSWPLSRAWGHYEVFGIARFFRDRIYPNDDRYHKSGRHRPSPAAPQRAHLTTAPSAAVLVAARARHSPTRSSRSAIKGLWGEGTGRYGTSTIADTTLRPNGQLALLHNFSALGTIEANPTARLTLYANYGGDYIVRRYFGKVGYGSPLTNMSGCNVEPVPGITTTNGGDGFTPSTPANCGGNTKDVQELSTGYWYDFYRGPAGPLPSGQFNTATSSAISGPAMVVRQTPAAARRVPTMCSRPRSATTYRSLDRT